MVIYNVQLLLSHVENDIHDIPVDIQTLHKMRVSFSCHCGHMTVGIT